MTVATDDEEKVDYEAIESHRKQYEEALNNNFERWKHNSLLEEVTEKNRKKLAILLENQMLFNEVATGKNPEDLEFMKFSLQLTKEVYGDFVGFDIINFHPMLGPVGLVFSKELRCSPRSDIEGYEVDLKIKEQEVIARSRLMPAFDVNDMKKDDFLKTHAKKLRSFLFREITTDLRNNSGTVSSRTYNDEEKEQIYLNTIQASDIIHRKTLRGLACWIVTGSAVGKKLQSEYFYGESQVDLDTLDEPKYIGTMCCAWKVFVDPAYPQDEMLIGHHDEESMCDSYFYCPYVPFASCGLCSAIEGEPTRLGTMMRYGKKLSISGAKYYSKIKYTKPEDKPPNYQI